MTKQPLHITNGSVLTDYLNELGIKGKKLTWQEMLCEGPTIEQIDNEEFLNLRKSFFNDFYDIDLETEKIKTELNKLNTPENYSEIILWFEYDLFCNINMIGVISLLKQKKINLPLYLVSSGRVKGHKNLLGLGELNHSQLLSHYQKKVLLTHLDIEFAATIWGIYCGKDHNLLKPFIVKSTTFKYLSNCLKAHLERFPNAKDGLSILEKNILEIVKNNDIKSKHHLLGYALNYQGYYGYGDIQLSRIIDKLSLFINADNNQLELNRTGHEALLGQHNFYDDIRDNMIYGGVKKSHFQFNKRLNKLVKTVQNAS